MPGLYPVRERSGSSRSRNAAGSNHPPSALPKGLTNSNYSRHYTLAPLSADIGDSCNVAANVGVVLQRLPRKRIMIVSNAEKSTKSQHAVRDFAAHLVDHHPLDRTNALIVGAINSRPFHLVVPIRLPVSCSS